MLWSLYYVRMMLGKSKAAESTANKPKMGLVLPGGGARCAYQVGVLKAVAELMPPRAVNPFAVISGTSAGAINCALMRWKELCDGVELENETGDIQYGKSKAAGR